MAAGSSEALLVRRWRESLVGAGITSMEAVTFKRSRFTGHAASVERKADVLALVDSVSALPECVAPFAYRLRGGGDGADVRGGVEGGASSRVEEPMVISEGWSDGGDVGVGEKLLNLVRQWDVENIWVCVTRDDSRSFVDGAALGVRRFKVVVDCAKRVLERCFLEAAHDQEEEEGEGEGEGEEAPPPAGVAEAAPEAAAPLLAVRLPTPPRGRQTPKIIMKRLPGEGPAAAPHHQQPSGRRPLGPDAIVKRPGSRPLMRPNREDPLSRLDPSLKGGRGGVFFSRGQVNNFRVALAAEQTEQTERLLLVAQKRNHQRRHDGGKRGFVFLGRPSPMAATEVSGGGRTEESPDDFLWFDGEERLHDKEATVTAAPFLDPTAIAGLRALRKPPEAVETAFRCTVALLAGPACLVHRVQPGTSHQKILPPTLDWVDVRAVLTQPDINLRLRRARPDLLPAGAAEAVYNALGAVRLLDTAAAESLRAKSMLAAAFLEWILATIAYELNNASSNHLVLLHTAKTSGGVGDKDEKTPFIAAAGARLVFPANPAARNIEKRRVQAVPVNES